MTTTNFILISIPLMIAELEHTPQSR